MIKMTHTKRMRIPIPGHLPSTQPGISQLTESMGTRRYTHLSEQYSPPFSVNLGGWFVLEPFITPALFQKYPTANDEWSISTLMAADTASGGLNQLEEHYKTFIVSPL